MSWCWGQTACGSWLMEISDVVCKSIWMIWRDFQRWEERRDGTIHTFGAVGTDGKGGDGADFTEGDHFGNTFKREKESFSCHHPSRCVPPWLPWRHISWRAPWARTPQGPHIWGWALWVWGSAFWLSPRKPSQGWRAPFWKGHGVRLRVVVVVVVEREREKGIGRNKGKKEDSQEREREGNKKYLFS